jgi:hypothetical protein
MKHSIGLIAIDFLDQDEERTGCFADSSNDCGPGYDSQCGFQWLSCWEKMSSASLRRLVITSYLDSWLIYTV